MNTFTCDTKYIRLIMLLYFYLRKILRAGLQLGKEYYIIWYMYNVVLLLFFLQYSAPSLQLSKEVLAE